MSQLHTTSPMEMMIQEQIVERGIRDQRVIEAIRSTPRERFFPEEEREAAYAHQATPIGHGQTISQPYIVALMSEQLEVEAGSRVLEIGTGSGYQTALLARLANQVYTVERLKPLLDAAWNRVMELGLRNVHFRLGDGTLGWPEQSPFDRILITAGAPVLPRELLLGQLKDGGIAVLPMGEAQQQMLVQVRRKGEELDCRDLCACRFVKLIGEAGWGEE